MKLVLLLVVCFVAVCAASRFTEEEYQSAFVDWQRTHNKAFSSDEFLQRFTNFKGMFDFVHEHNAKNLSWTVGLNGFSHLTSAEFKHLYLADLSKIPRSSTDLPMHADEGERVARGTFVDWRASGKVNPIRDQGQCGSCWTFAATAAIEGAWAIKTNRLPQLSEQQLLDCTPSGQGCNGGWPQDAINYVANTAKGHDTRASYPYQTAKSTCRYNAANSGATVTGATNVPAGNEGALLTAVQKGPTVVCIDAGQPSFQSYKTGIYNDPACTTTLNHAVTAVGWGNDGAGDYWIVRNSWNTWWGNQGYFLLAKGVNRCGVANAASYATTTGTGNRV